MSLRLEMLQVARVAAKVLGESADLVSRFLVGRLGAEGGGLDRTQRPDLYYTVFTLDGLMALNTAFNSDPTQAYLEGFQGGEGLDFVHLCSLARAWGTLSNLRPGVSCPKTWSAEIIGRIERHRTSQGGYHPLIPAIPNPGTAYGAFLACGAYQDLGQPLPDQDRLITSLQALRSRDGAWGNEWVGNQAVPIGSTNATAAAVTVLRQYGHPIPPAIGEWLAAQFHAEGGFLAIPRAPIPDLLSTATALHALSGMGWNLDPWRERTLDFIDTLWTNEGGFHGHWTDDHLDAEYTYYGLLALGHLL